MSYEPYIIIFKPDLDDNRNVIEEFIWKKEPKRVTEKFTRRKAAYDELYKALSCGSFKIQEKEMILIKPEFTSHNDEVRQLLYDLNIEFATDD